MTAPLPRRTLLLGGLALGAANCTRPAPDDQPPSSPPAGRSGRVLLAYFSRAGENYYYGDRRNLTVGNTEVLATMIAELIDCDTYRIEAADPYPDSYDATVQRNTTEQDADARPAIANPLASITDYDHVLLGSPIWNQRPPMIMTTFADAHDFTGLTVHPFVTYAVSGLGSTEDVYTTACTGAQISPGLAVQGEEVPQHRGDVETWLRERRLLN
ncbi:flavodoxin [Microlunatus parietis]|uniref:Flavodoxin n=1 Tax=Microlunatus parietis TaxID=682979 RepID=A0A7Y9I879_9ACTN|nr:flavodoxin [Microlunatus parietis]NYE71875.1 flavodoxin [Microlunatus parietis]